MNTLEHLGAISGNHCLSWRDTGKGEMTYTSFGFSLKLNFLETDWKAAGDAGNPL